MSRTCTCVRYIGARARRGWGTLRHELGARGDPDPPPAVVPPAVVVGSGGADAAIVKEYISVTNASSEKETCRSDQPSSELGTRAAAHPQGTHPPRVDGARDWPHTSCRIRSKKDRPHRASSLPDSIMGSRGLAVSTCQQIFRKPPRTGALPSHGTPTVASARTGTHLLATLVVSCLRMASYTSSEFWVALHAQCTFAPP